MFFLFGSSKRPRCCHKSMSLIYFFAVKIKKWSIKNTAFKIISSSMFFFASINFTLSCENFPWYCNEWIIRVCGLNVIGGCNLQRWFLFFSLSFPPIVRNKCCQKFLWCRAKFFTSSLKHMCHKFLLDWP